MVKAKPGARLCTECKVVMTVLPDGVCQPCVRSANPSSRKERACTTCGEPTKSKHGAHQGCRSVESVNAAIPESELALPKGDWRFDPFRRCQVYVLAPPEPKSTERTEHTPGPKPVNVPNEEAWKFDCDKCGVKAGSLCVRPDGRPCYTETHTDRRRAVLAWHREQEEPVLDELAPRECAYDGCGDWFVPGNSRQLYCSERHKGAAYHMRRRARDRGEVAA